MLWPGIMATSLLHGGNAGPGPVDLLRVNPGNTQAETGKASTTHHQNRSPPVEVGAADDSGQLRFVVGCAQAMSKRLGWLTPTNQTAH
jgi:hypothetical protein